MQNPGCSVSVIIPAYREQGIINAAIEGVRRLSGGGTAEIIVVDGGPEGETIAVIRDTAVKTIRSGKGRGLQLNQGARSAAGGGLLFLHADTTLPPTALERIGEVLGNEAFVGGAFDLSIASPRRGFRVIEQVANWRSRLTRIPYGDQAIFIRAADFNALGGFREIPIMEDVDLMRRIKRNRGRIVILREPVRTSARRWEQEGMIYGTLRNWLLITLYLCGVPPERLARFYR
ncbi:MAG: TIGR04283 family arsenosugar biosynthesis glycosyltransferase [Deltaproteobacteria bacterium]|nr:TIGR04283 family arsenosugar biosynthesis glycosyltransferase [Deltaproteobacteria bacterium]